MIEYLELVRINRLSLLGRNRQLTIQFHTAGIVERILATVTSWHKTALWRQLIGSPIFKTTLKLKMKLLKSTQISSVALALPFLLFIWFTYAADRAMDKSGVGDVDAFQRYTGLAGFSFWLDIAVFIVLLLLLFFKIFPSSLERIQILNVLKIYIVSAPTLYVAFLFSSFS